MEQREFRQNRISIEPKLAHPYFTGTGVSKIAVLGNSEPRRCGIATFTTHLTEALSARYPDAIVDTIAMTDRGTYDYPSGVKFEIPEQDVHAYIRAAKFLNEGGYDVLSVQHEFGIFGGPAGSYLLTLLREVKMPIVTTLHTVLREPDEAQRRVMDELVQLSERVIVMSEKGVEFLNEIYQVPIERIDLVHHGIPSFEGSPGSALRQTLGKASPVILTFGLLSPDKGIQYVIEAMPQIVADHPNAKYIVLGATHPNIRAGQAGESYRDSLLAKASELGVLRNVEFVDRFVTEEELTAYLDASDIYITPYLNPKQITSGTLAYAVGAGKAVISTPYWYAEELLEEGRGILVPFRNSESIANAVLTLQNNPFDRQEMSRRARQFGVRMGWPEVADRYLEALGKAKSNNSDHLKTMSLKTRDEKKMTIPALNLDHLMAMTDDTGLFQHATHDIPNRNEGYCVDDNARGLILMARLAAKNRTPATERLMARYLSFVLHAFNPKTGRFRNFMSYGREWLEISGSDDSHGRSIWALGTVIGRCASSGSCGVSVELFRPAMPALLATRSPRTWAYGILGACEFLTGMPDDPQVADFRARLAARLLSEYRVASSSDWRWFEDVASYANGRLSQALILAGRAMGEARMVHAGLESLTWLMDVQTSNGVFVPISSHGYHRGDTERSLFDQQPLEAWVSVSACISAAEATGDSVWTENARRAFGWFLGENLVHEQICRPETGGSCDGLHSKSVNLNQGAESTLSYLCSLVELEQAESSALLSRQRVDLL